MAKFYQTYDPSNTSRTLNAKILKDFAKNKKAYVILGKKKYVLECVVDVGEIYLIGGKEIE